LKKGVKKLNIKQIIMHYQSEYDDNDNIGKLKQYYVKFGYDMVIDTILTILNEYSNMDFLERDHLYFPNALQFLIDSYSTDLEKDDMQNLTEALESKCFFEKTKKYYTSDYLFVKEDYIRMISCFKTNYNINNLKNIYYKKYESKNPIIIWECLKALERMNKEDYNNCILSLEGKTDLINIIALTLFYPGEKTEEQFIKCQKYYPLLFKSTDFKTFCAMILYFSFFVFWIQKYNKIKDWGKKEYDVVINYYIKNFHDLFDMKNSNLLQDNKWEDVYKKILKQKTCT
jgi:hypothetical protein